jgi:hypothetical protein
MNLLETCNNCSIPMLGFCRSRVALSSGWQRLPMPVNRGFRLELGPGRAGGGADFRSQDGPPKALVGCVKLSRAPDRG